MWYQISWISNDNGTYRKTVVMFPDGEQRDMYARQYFARVEVKTVVMMGNVLPETCRDWT